MDVYIYIYIYIYIYGILYWRIFRSSYRKFVWVVFEPTTTEFRSNALSDWGIRPWVQVAGKTDFLQLLQFHPFIQCPRFISVSQVITLVADSSVYMQSWKQCILPVTTRMALWQLMLLGTWCTVTHCWYHWTKECSTSYARGIIWVVISDPRHAERSNLAEARWA